MNHKVIWPQLTMAALRILINELPDEAFEAGPDDPWADGNYTCRGPQSKQVVRLTYRRWDADDVAQVKIIAVFGGALIGSEFQLDRSDLQKRDIDYLLEMFIKPACYAIADRIKAAKNVAA